MHERNINDQLLLLLLLIVEFLPVHGDLRKSVADADNSGSLHATYLSMPIKVTNHGRAQSRSSCYIDRTILPSSQYHQAEGWLI